MRTSSTNRIIAFSGTLLCAAVTLVVLATKLDGHRGERPHQLLYGGLLAIAFGVCEIVVVHFDVGDDGHTTSLSEIPLVVGLFLLDPRIFVAARVIGALVALRLCRRQPSVKLFFNTCSVALEAALAVSIYGALGQPSIGVESWFVATGAAAIASVDSALAVLAAIALSGGQVRHHHLTRMLIGGVSTACFGSTLAVLSVAATHEDSLMIIPIGLAAMGLVLYYRHGNQQSVRLARLSVLQEAIHDLTPATTEPSLVRSLLEQAREKLKADRAVLHLIEFDGEPAGVRYVLTADGLSRTEVESPLAVAEEIDALADGVLIAERDSRTLQWPLLGQHARDTVIVPLHLASPTATGSNADHGIRYAVALSVHDRRTDHSTFVNEDLAVLSGIAQHGSLTLLNARLLDRLMHESRHDALTGLPNRTDFHERLTGALAGDLAGDLAVGRPVCAVLLADLDAFKEVNDSLGHHAGDLLLQQVSSRLLAALPKQASIARLGGDEFVVLCQGADEAAALAVAASLTAALQNPVEIDSVKVNVGASIGIALAPEHGTTADLLLRHADVAMYHSKQVRGTRIYDAAHDTNDAGRLQLAGELRDGITRGELRLAAQPQAGTASREVQSVEMLVRWEHPQRGLLYPDSFIAIAERTGLLPAITAWVLAASLDFLQAWRLAGHDLGVSVNLSPQDLEDPELPAKVRWALSQRDLEPSSLTLEITEATMMADHDAAVCTLRALREQGVRISVDDFGTGHSSLAYLATLPIDELKIDRSFVSAINTNAAQRAIVAAISRLAADLGLTTVAEGVEDEVSWRGLESLGVDLIQGYHLARPMPAAALPGWLETQHRLAKPSESNETPGTRDGLRLVRTANS